MSNRIIRGALLAALGVAVRAEAQGPDTVRISISDAVARTLRESDEIKVAAAQVDVTEGAVTTARAAGLPQARVTGAYTQTVLNAQAAIVSSLFGQSYRYTSNLNVSQPVFQGGRIFAGMRAASATRGASRLTFNETKSRLAVDAQRAYLGAVLARELVTIQEQNLTLADQRLAQVQQLESAGRASRYDLLKARVERANFEPGLLLARSNSELADITLRQLLNLPDAAPIVLTTELDTASLRSAVQTVAADTMHGMLRPAIRAAEMTLDARREGVRIARADFMPTINVFVQTGYTALPNTPGFPTVWGHTAANYCPAGSADTRVCQNSGWYPDRSFGVQFSWLVFDGLRAKGNVDLASANERLARTQLAQEREAVAVELARAMSEFARAEATFETQHQNTAEADEAFRIASLRFERGLGTQLEVTDAQVALFTARVNAARASIDYYLAAAELARSRGHDIPLPPTRAASR
jgi:outer membrane protein TolC